MSLIQYNNYDINIADNWGWYVDTENLSTLNNFEYRQSVRIFKKPKMFHTQLNIIDKIIEEEEEDEGEVDINNIIKNNVQITIYDSSKAKEKYHLIFYLYDIAKICSATIITLLFTYIIYFLI